MKDGALLEWVMKLLDSFSLVWHAQDVKSGGDPREFDVILRELAEERQPITTTDAEGRRTVMRRRVADGTVFTFTFLDRPDGTRHEEYVWDVPEPIDPKAWREVIDQMHMRWIQQRREFPRLRSSVPMHVENGAALAEFTLCADTSAWFVLEVVVAQPSPSEQSDYESDAFKQTVTIGGTIAQVDACPLSDAAPRTPASCAVLPPRFSSLPRQDMYFGQAAVDIRALPKLEGTVP